MGFNTLNQDFINQIKEQAKKAPAMENLDKAALALAGVYEELGKALTDFQNAFKDPKLLEKEGYEGGEADSYISEALKFKGSVAALINRIENKVKVDEFKLKHNFPMENEDGSPEQVYDIMLKNN